MNIKIPINENLQILTSKGWIPTSSYDGVTNIKVLNYTNKLIKDLKVVCNRVGTKHLLYEYATTDLSFSMIGFNDSKTITRTNERSTITWFEDIIIRNNHYIVDNFKKPYSNQISNFKSDLTKKKASIFFMFKNNKSGSKVRYDAKKNLIYWNSKTEREQSALRKLGLIKYFKIENEVYSCSNKEIVDCFLDGVFLIDYNDILLYKELTDAIMFCFDLFKDCNNRMIINDNKIKELLEIGCFYGNKVVKFDYETNKVKIVEPIKNTQDLSIGKLEGTGMISIRGTEEKIGDADILIVKYYNTIYFIK